MDSWTAHADRLLLQHLDGVWRQAAELAGDRLACRPGCTECCIGPFPITALDAARLRAGLAALEETDPARAAAVRARAEADVVRLRRDFPGDPRTGWLAGDGDGGEAGDGEAGGDDTREAAFLERHRELPCSALDPATGRCDVYDHRPILCRTYGPPVRVGDEDLPPCRLCFVDAAGPQIEAARVTTDGDGLEGAILLDLDPADPHGERATLVAFCLAAPRA